MKKKLKLKILFVFLCLSFLSLLFITNKLISLNEQEIKQIDISFPQQMVTACSKEDIFEDAYCFNNLIKTFYKYNASNIGKDLDFEELKEQGGVCNQWSDFYCSVGDKLGYYTSTPSFETEKMEKYLISHQICIWSNFEGYVIFDGETLVETHFNTNSTEIIKEILK